MKARVTVTLLDNGNPTVPPQLNNVNIGAHETKTFHMNDFILSKGPTPLLITADETVVAERDIYRSRIGLGMSMAIPLRA